MASLEFPHGLAAFFNRSANYFLNRYYFINLIWHYVPISSVLTVNCLAMERMAPPAQTITEILPTVTRKWRSTLVGGSGVNKREELTRMFVTL